MKRKIIRIDEEKCTGCGECIPDCPEGALKIVDGKARLVSESLCDGLGACVGRCPTGALTVEERDADVFDEEKAKENTEKAHSGCPGMKIMSFENNSRDIKSNTSQSALSQWPVQLKLLNPLAPYFKNADILIAADCVPFSYPDFHNRFLKEKKVIVFCPKLDGAYGEYVEKLARIISENDVRSVTIVHMEVPCCGGTTAIVEDALKKSGKRVIIKDYTISLQGEII